MLFSTPYLPEFKITEVRHTCEEIYTNPKNQNIIIDINKVEVIEFSGKPLDGFRRMDHPSFYDIQRRECSGCLAIRSVAYPATPVVKLGVYIYIYCSI